MGLVEFLIGKGTPLMQHVDYGKETESHESGNEELHAAAGGADPVVTPA